MCCGLTVRVMLSQVHIIRLPVSSYFKFFRGSVLPDLSRLPNFVTPLLKILAMDTIYIRVIAVILGVLRVLRVLCLIQLECHLTQGHPLIRQEQWPVHRKTSNKICFSYFRSKFEKKDQQLQAKSRDLQVLQNRKKIVRYMLKTNYCKVFNTMLKQMSIS